MFGAIFFKAHTSRIWQFIDVEHYPKTKRYHKTCSITHWCLVEFGIRYFVEGCAESQNFVWWTQI
jgi:hypothetical protein